MQRAAIDKPNQLAVWQPFVPGAVWRWRDRGSRYKKSLASFQFALQGEVIQAGQLIRTDPGSFCN
jgi:hypothetical protein